MGIKESFSWVSCSEVIMLFRKCNHDHPFYIIFDNFIGCPNGVWEKKATDKKYIVVNDEDIDLETDSLPEAEVRYLELCDAAHSGSAGRYLIGKHKLVDFKVKVIN